MNVDRPGRRNKIYMNDEPGNFPMSLSNDNFEFFVHGTDHDRAKTIIEEGILLSKGAERQDFSDGTGFYLGNDLDEAVMWARHKYQGGEAVLIYQVDKKELRGDNNEKGLDLRNNKNEWKQVVTEYRLTGYGRRQEQPNKAYRRELKQNHFIEGPMASVSRNNPIPKEKVGTYQLCVRKEACAKLFDCSLSYVIFFERGKKRLKKTEKVTKQLPEHVTCIVCRLLSVVILVLLQLTQKLNYRASLFVAYLNC